MEASHHLVTFLLLIPDMAAVLCVCVGGGGGGSYMTQEFLLYEIAIMYNIPLHC